MGDAEEEIPDVNLRDLDPQTIRKYIDRLIDAGVIDADTLEPIMTLNRCLIKDKMGSWSRLKIGNTTFDLPESMTEPTYLAAGGYGSVARAWYQGKQVAIKKVPVPRKSNESEAVRLLREIAILKKARDHGQKSICEIIELYGTAGAATPEELKHYYIVMPLYSPGCLEKFTVDTPELYKTIATHTLQALYWLHTQDILHRDIKRENVFYDRESNRAVLGDFGSARRFTMTKMTGKKEVGTKCYLAPEFIGDKGKEVFYSYSSDVWALGIVWWEMLTHAGSKTLFPWSTSGGNEHLIRQYSLCNRKKTRDKYGRWQKNKWDKVKAKCAEWGEESIERILSKVMIFKPEERATIEDLYLDPYFAETKQDVRPIQIPGVDCDDYEAIQSHLFYSQTMQGRHMAGGSSSCRSSTRASTARAAITTIPDDCSPRDFPWDQFQDFQDWREAHEDDDTGTTEYEEDEDEDEEEDYSSSEEEDVHKSLNSKKRCRGGGRGNMDNMIDISPRPKKQRLLASPTPKIINSQMLRVAASPTRHNRYNSTSTPPRVVKKKKSVLGHAEMSMHPISSVRDEEDDDNNEDGCGMM